ncbi:MAG: MATE family efflux transporter [SAR324 cluster bacterium]|nr:MATE family efflux transporter [SAR324 cluster bacterium]
MAAKDLTQGSIPHLMLRLALPVLGSFVLQSLYTLTDLYFVGLLGETQVAGLAIAFNGFFTTLAVGMTVGVGALAILSQAYGAGLREQVPYVFQQVFWGIIITGMVYGALGWYFTDSLIGLFTSDPAVQAEGAAYFRIYTMTFLTMLFMMVIGFCFRAVGDFITPTVLMAIGVVTNIVLDPLLIFGVGPFPELGIRGAALATVASQTMTVGIYLWLVFKPHPRRILGVRRPFVLDLSQFFRVVRIGWPAGMQMALYAVIMMLVYRGVRPFGGEATAAVGIGFRIIQAAILPIVAVGAAVSALSGQNFGASDLARVKTTVMWGSLYTGSLMCLAYAGLGLWPEFWVSLFSDQPAVVAIGADYLILSGVGLPFHGVSYMVTAMAQGLGRNLYPLFGQLFRVLGFLLALAILDGYLSLGLKGIFWSYAAAYGAEFISMGAALALLWVTVLKPRIPVSTPITGSASESG